MANGPLLVQQQPGQYRQLAQAIGGGQNPYAQYYQQPQQQQQPQLPGGSGIAQQFMGGGGTPGGAGGAGGAGGGGGGSGMSAVASNPYVWLAALLAAKAYDTKKHGTSYEDQLKNISLAPQRDFDRWGLEKYTPAGGGDVYKGTFDLASGDISNWLKSFKSPVEKLFGVNI